MTDNIIEADVVIIGSGVAGALTAYKLAQSGAKVVVLEAGPRIERADVVKKFTQSHKFDFSSGFPNTEHAPRPDWQEKDKNYIRHTGPEKPQIEYIRAVGGTTWHWSGFASRLSPEDFKMKSTYGVGIDWPIDYRTLEPWYCEAEAELGVAGIEDPMPQAKGLPEIWRSKPYPMPPVPRSYSDSIIEKKLKKIGLHFSTPPAARATKPYDGRVQCMGFGTCSPICPSGAQYAAINHVIKAEKLGARVLENTRVDKLVTDTSGRISEVIAKQPDGTELRARAKIFVLAANGLESPRLLLMSANESNPKGLANSSGRVGRFLHEHPGIVCRFVMPEPVYPRGPEVTMGCGTFMRGNFRRRRAGWAMGVHNFPHHHESADLLMKKGLEPPALDPAIRKRVLGMLDMNTQIEQLPYEQNGITLDWSRRDSAGQPGIDLYVSYTDYERASFALIRKMFTRIVKTLGAEMLSISEPVAQHHPLGMAMMGADKKYSVTDQYGRSHDHPNLFIQGMALFPTAGMHSPTLTISALALRNAEEVKRQLKA